MGTMGALIFATFFVTFGFLCGLSTRGRTRGTHRRGATDPAT